MFYFEGNQVIESPLMADFNVTPKKQVELKRWMVGKCYCQRVNKKWLKRYGVNRERLFLMGHGSIVASPANVKLLRSELDGENAKRNTMIMSPGIGAIIGLGAIC